jgi:lambda repressor-like predicted transcriptional regulator
MGRRKLRKSKKKTAKKARPRKQGSGLDELRRRWDEFTPLERGQRLRALKKQGLSTREMARQIKLSEKTVRNYLLLTELSREEEQAVVAGRLGKKRALRRVRERRKSKAPSEEEERAFVSTCGALLADFIERRALPAYWEQFLQELKGRSNGLRLQELAGRGPAPTPVRLAKNPRKTLTKCRPGGEIPKYVPELISYCVEWLVNWFLLVLPNMKIREAVINRAEQLLEEKPRT